MYPTSFAESNAILDKPEELSRDQCDALSVWSGALPNGLPVIISCWKPTQGELEKINKTGRIWLMVWGSMMPPVSLLGITPFETSEKGS